MKLIKETLLEFQKGMDPVDSLGMGRRQMIKDWLEMMENESCIEDYIINEDYTIDSDSSVVFDNMNLTNFPYYIQFGKVDGMFSCTNNILTSLRGCPKIVRGTFWCESNKLVSLEGAPEIVNGDFVCDDNKTQFTKDDVCKVCDVEGEIYV